MSLREERVKTLTRILKERILEQLREESRKELRDAMKAAGMDDSVLDEEDAADYEG